MEKKLIKYGDFLIRANPQQLMELEEWTTRITIEVNSEDKIHSRPFSARNTFKTYDEAVRNCYRLGKMIVDRNVDGCTVSDLV